MSLFIIVGVGITLMILERAFPDQKLPSVSGWWPRVIVVNCFQLAVVLLGGVTWDRWFLGRSIFELDVLLPKAGQVFIAYLVITFVYYWWHRVRHDNNFLWLVCHQLHHSPSRIETITSFYKHPIELVANGILICVINFGLLGISVTAGGWVTVVTAVAEFFYHMNIRTPRWVGYLIQRPEMHRVHHQRGKHYNNFSDLPVWDMLFGTYVNPDRFDGECGFLPERELAFSKILSCRNVNGVYKRERPVQGDEEGKS